MISSCTGTLERLFKSRLGSVLKLDYQYRNGFKNVVPLVCNLVYTLPAL